MIEETRQSKSIFVLGVEKDYRESIKTFIEKYG